MGALALEPEFLTNDPVEAFLPEPEGNFVNRVRDVEPLNDGVAGDVAEEGDFVADVLGERVLAPGHDDLRHDPDFAEFGHALLGRLGLEFSSGLDEGDEGDVDEEDVFGTDVVGELADRFEEGETLDVADGAADFGDDDVASHFLGDFVDAGLDLRGDVRNDLNGLALEFAAALLANDPVIHLAAREIVELGEHAIREPLVVAQVEVGFGAVVEDVDFPVLERAHRPRIDVEVGVELLQDDLETPVFQEGAQGCRCQPFAEGTDHPSCKEYVFHPALIKAVTIRACSGVSTPGESSLVKRTRIRAPFSRARSCSSPSVCSRIPGGQETNWRRKSRR